MMTTLRSGLRVCRSFTVHAAADRVQMTICAGCALAVLSACGGGGGSSAPPPSVSLTASMSTLSGGATTVTASATPENLGSQTVTQYMWSWGDGQSSTSSGATASHTYTVATTYPVTVTAQLTAGQVQQVQATQSVSIEILPLAPGSPTSGYTGYGITTFTTPTANPIVSLETDLTVPEKPAATGTLYVWPGLEPIMSSSTYLPIGEGVLQSVLTWGPDCAPVTQPTAYSTWWIAGEYVSTDCESGPALSVSVGDVLHLALSLDSDGETWHQEITDMTTGQSVSYDKNLGGQEQNYVLLAIETYGVDPVDPIHFNNTVITWQGSSPGACFPNEAGPTDSVSLPQLSADGTTCDISEIVLRGPGIAATAE